MPSPVDLQNCITYKGGELSLYGNLRTSSVTKLILIDFQSKLKKNFGFSSDKKINL